MKAVLEIINPTTDVEWDGLLLKSEGYSFFHSSNWAKVLCGAYGYVPLYFSLIEDNKLSVAIPIMEIRSLLSGCRGVSLPFSDYCNPIINSNVRFKDVFEQLINYGKKEDWKYIELRGDLGIPEDLITHSHYYDHTLSLLSNEKQMLSNFRSSTKRNIKKATKEGVVVNIHKSIESIDEFYRLNCMTRKNHGLPPQPYSFFKKIYECVISKGLGIIALASIEKRIIAGALYFHFGKRVIFKYGASEKRYQHLRANNLVMWEAIKWYARNGYHSFSFGRTELENEGLRQFKTGWGAVEKIIKYYRYDLRKNAFISGDYQMPGLINKVFNNMPMPILKLFGSIFYKHAG